MTTYHNYVNAEWVSSCGEGVFEDVNPANTTDIIGAFPASTNEDMQAATSVAADAYRDWRAKSWPDRGAYLTKAADILERRLDEVAAALTREEGKTLGESRGETLRAVLILRYYGMDAYREIGDVIPSANASTLMFSRREPLGVVTLVTPWNFPVAIPIWKAAPALVYGNTVVMKPSELSPMTAHLIAEVFDEAGIPPGVFNVVHGPGAAMMEELTSPPVKAISFTGSIETGNMLAIRATENGLKFQLEMGGKNPVIVLPDANLDKAVELTVSGAFRSAGEKCTATSRAIVVGNIAEEFTERVVERTKQLKIGPGTDPDSYLGPVISARARTRVLEQAALAEKKGARVLCGGRIPDDEELRTGYYVAPTVIGGVKPHMTIARKEVFGPVLAIIEVSSFDEAIDVANDVRYGLSASLFTDNLDNALEYADRIEAGLVRINGETTGVEPQAPFGGMKASSSHSREQGRAALEFYTQIKTIYFDRSRT